MNRPSTLHAVAARSDSIEDFGRHFQDWLHEIAKASSRPQLAAAIREEPARLARTFPQGAVADAWLAAYAELVSRQTGLRVPEWTRGRVSPEPWFAVGGTDARSRLAALRDSPAPFKARNLYTPFVELPFRLAAGRPAKPAAELRRRNSERQRRFRERRRREWARLRRALGA